MPAPVDDRETWLLRAVTANIPVVLWAMDLKGICTYSCGIGLDRFGLTDHEAVGRSVLGRYADNPETAQAYRRALTGESFRAEISFAGVPLETWFQPRFGADGRLEEVLGVSVDICELVRTREVQREVADEHRAMLLQLLAAQEAERHELAGRMHDDTIQVLAAVDLRVQLLKKRLEQRADLEGAAEVDALHVAVHNAVDRLRGVLFALEPPSLGDGLGGALRDLAAAVFQGTAVAFDVVVDAKEPISERAARVLYRIAGEALSNVARHADAQLVVITVAAESFGWALTVVDDGKGPGADGFAERAGHHGLVGMRERVTDAGGSLSLHASAGGGTQLRAWVPTRAGALLSDVPPLDLREPLREILDEADEAFVALDREWNYVFVNRRAADLSHLTAREMEGKNIWAQFPALVGSNFYLQCHRAMAEQHPTEFADYADGRWYENRVVPTRQGLFAFYRDVTEQRRAWQRADHSGDAGALLLAASNVAMAGESPRRQVELLLGAIVESRWFTAARVYAPDGTLFAESLAPEGRVTTPRGPHMTGSQLLSEPLPGGIGGSVEFEGQVPVHLAVRWLARVVATMVTPAVRDRALPRSD
jgi:PAS domain S-box-containing protein